MTILLVIHGFIALLLIGVILLQKSEGGGGLGLGGSNSSGNVFSARGAANFLTRMTAILAALFFANCLLMGVIAKREVAQTSALIDGPAPVSVGEPSAKETLANQSVSPVDTSVQPPVTETKESKPVSPVPAEKKK